MPSKQNLLCGGVSAATVISNSIHQTYTLNKNNKNNVAGTPTPRHAQQPPLHKESDIKNSPPPKPVARGETPSTGKGKAASDASPAESLPSLSLGALLSPTESADVALEEPAEGNLTAAAGSSRRKRELTGIQLPAIDLTGFEEGDNEEDLLTAQFNSEARSEADFDGKWTADFDSPADGGSGPEFVYALSSTTKYHVLLDLSAKMAEKDRWINVKRSLFRFINLLPVGSRLHIIGNYFWII